MASATKVRDMTVFAGLLTLALIGLGDWAFLSRAGGLAAPSSNAIMVIAPHWDNGTWGLDDASAGLRREPFVAGVPEMMDVLVKDIPGAREGFRLLFSA